MKILNTTRAEIEKALANINSVYFNGNIQFERLDPANQKGTAFNVSLRTINSKGPGHARGPSGRRSWHACWHVVGHFIAALFELNPTIKVRTAFQKIDSPRDNWKDRNIGSIMHPLLHSDACDCGSE